MDNEQLIKKVKAALTKVKPYLAANGNDVKFVKLDGTTLTINLKTAAKDSAALFTLKAGVESFIREECPEVKVIELGK